MEKHRKDQEWIDLYEYVKKEIMGYTDEKLSKYMVLRLKGLEKGQFLANKKQTPMANYTFKSILYTFKLCKQDIIVGFRTNNTKFTGEQHKFNYAMVIIENNINDMVTKLNNVEKAKEKAENVELENIYHKGADYTSKTKKTNHTLEDLW